MRIRNNNSGSGSRQKFRIHVDPAPQHCRTCFLYDGGCRAGGQGQALAITLPGAQNTLKQDSKRFNSITKAIHFDHLVVLHIYLWLPSSAKEPAAPDLLPFISSMYWH